MPLVLQSGDRLLLQSGDELLFQGETGIEGPVAPTITSATTASGQVGEAFEYTITATGDAPITYGATGLPAGLTRAGAVISGTPTTAGESAIALSATNAVGSDTETLTLTIDPLVATGYTLTGPTSGAIGQTRTFTASLSPSESVHGSDVVITPSLSPDGTLSSPTVTIPQGSSSATFAATWDTEGIKTVNVTNDAGFSNPDGRSISISATLPRRSRGLRLSANLGL